MSEPRQVKNFGQWEGENLTRECYGPCDWLGRDSGGFSDSALTCGGRGRDVKEGEEEEEDG